MFSHKRRVLLIPAFCKLNIIFANNSLTVRGSSYWRPAPYLNFWIYISIYIWCQAGGNVLLLLSYPIAHPPISPRGTWFHRLVDWSGREQKKVSFRYSGYFAQKQRWALRSRSIGFSVKDNIFIFVIAFWHRSILPKWCPAIWSTQAGDANGNNALCPSLPWPQIGWYSHFLDLE